MDNVENEVCVLIDGNSSSTSIKTVDSINTAVANKVMDNAEVNSNDVTNCNNSFSDGIEESASDVPVSLNKIQKDGDPLVNNKPSDSVLISDSNAKSVIVEENSVVDGKTVDLVVNSLGKDDSNLSSSSLQVDSEKPPNSSLDDKLETDKKQESDRKDTETEKSTESDHLLSKMHEICNSSVQDEPMDVDESLPMCAEDKSTSEGSISEPACESASKSEKESTADSSLPHSDALVNDNGTNHSDKKDLGPENEKESKSSCSEKIAVSKEQEDSNQLLGLDESSTNLSESNSTKFHDCDQELSQDVQDDVQEQVAVDPFAQTEDAYKEFEESMNVDETKEQGKESDVSDKIEETEKQPDNNDVQHKTDSIENKDESMEVDESDSKRQTESDVIKVSKEKTNDEKESVEVDDDEKSAEKDTCEKVDETVDVASSEKEMTDDPKKTDDTPVDEVIKPTADSEEKKDVESKSSGEKESNQDAESSASSEKQTVPEVVADKEAENTGKEAENTDKEAENKDKEAENTVTATNVVEESASKTTESAAVEEVGSKDKDDSSKEKTNVVDAEIEIDEDICIIPDTVRLPPSISDGVQKSSSISVSSKVLNEVSGKQNVKKELPEVKQEGSSSGRPQRQAAKRADAQIKATVKEMELFMEEEGEKENEEDADESNLQLCQQCTMVKPCKFTILNKNEVSSYLCSELCANLYRDALILADQKRAAAASGSDKQSTSLGAGNVHINEAGEFVRSCSQCRGQVSVGEQMLSWETMDFCNEDCLGKFQNCLGSHCACCKKAVQQTSLGKYCVRFGYDIRQFCSSTCLEEYKRGLKTCSFCQKDISSLETGFLAPVGDKGTFKDFCTQSCMEKYDQMSNNQPPPPQMHVCDVCNNNKLVSLEVLVDSKLNKLCSEVCFAAFKFVNNAITVDQCDMCRKYFERSLLRADSLTVYYDNTQHNFCCKTCMNVYILAKRKIVPCNWCKVKKYNFDMIKRVLDSGQTLMMCSLNCLTLYKVSINAVSSRRIKCDSCGSVAQAQYHLTMSDATIRNFCTYPCVMNFQAQYSKNPITLPGGQQSPIPTGGPKRAIQPVSSPKDTRSGPVPIISSVTSLATNGQTPTSLLQSSPPVNSLSPVVQPAKISTLQVTSTKTLPVSSSMTSPSTATVSASTTCNSYVIVRERSQPKMVNKCTSYRPTSHTKGVSCKPHACSKEVQTDGIAASDGKTVMIPVPVPIYIPTPMHMFSMPVPVAVPFPLPIPVPIFIPTTRGSAEGILKEIKRIHEKIPTDPFEAELLMMAEMVAEDKKSESGSISEGDAASVAAVSPDRSDSPVPETLSKAAEEENSNAHSDDDDMIMPVSCEISEGETAFDADLTVSKIVLPKASRVSSSIAVSDDEEDVDDPEPIIEEPVKRKRGRPPLRGNYTPAAKRGRRSSSYNNSPAPSVTSNYSTPGDSEKSDPVSNLKFMLGVNAWKQWAILKNAELTKVDAATPKKPLTIKQDLLQLTAEELNYSLCLFIKEARKPNGSEYTPDTIYYFCLGIQQYLFDNGRIDNIFTDPFYDSFTEALHEIAQKFQSTIDDSYTIVTRVEEEHLWESKQLGAHSPHVLLCTLMFFNTKYFNLKSVQDHMQLSFSHIMKHWKRNPNQPGTSSAKPPAGARNVLLRFYPPVNDTKKKRAYEQHENEDNPLRCPVKLYEFYLSKCPESVKTRSDVFYLQPERSCVPDSPVWYSTMTLGEEALSKVLHRVKMVKEINIALVNS